MRKLLLVALILSPLVSLTAAPKVPATAELKTLTRDSLLQFNQAVQTKDFGPFHKKISKLWQEQITPGQLQDAFRTFIDQRMDLSAIATSEPVFQPAPKIDSDEVLTVEGTYPTKPNKVAFRLKYVNESGAWKLIGLKVNMTPNGPTDVKAPDEKETTALARASLLSFNNAVQKKTFAGFYKEVAQVWQDQTTPEKLEELFQTFIDKEVDISPIADLAPTFTKPAAVNEDGLLEVQGSYPTKPSTVRFDLAYIFEAPNWRLVKINVQVGKPAGSLSND